MRFFTAFARCASLAALMGVMMLVQQAEAEVTIQLGGAGVGWTNNTYVDYNQLLSNTKVKVGDTVQFSNFDPGTNHTVVVVDKEGYDSCGNTGAKYRTATISYGQYYTVTFGQSGNFYAICDIPEHCDQGQKVYIQVLNQDGSVDTAASEAPGTSGASPMPGLSWTNSQLIVIVLASTFALQLMAAAAAI